MRRRVIGAVGAVLATAAFAAPAHAFDVCNDASCPYATIQDAVDHTGPGATITVGAGTYSGGVVVGAHHDGLTIAGAQAGHHAESAGAGPRDGGESIVSPPGTAFAVQSDNVTITGFTIRDGGLGVYPGSATSGQRVLETIFVNEGNAVVPDSSGASPDAIEHNAFVDAAPTGGFLPGDAIVTGASAGNLIVEHNLFRNAFRAGVETLPFTAPSDIVIRDNVVDGDAHGPAGGLAFLWHVQDATLERNTVTAAHQNAIFVGQGDGVEVRDNQIADTIPNTGAVVLGGTSGAALRRIVVEGNDFRHNGAGFAVLPPAELLDVPQVHFNRFTGNADGIFVLVPGTIDARHNWWGCNAGPGRPGCDRSTVVGGPVTTDPWQVLSLDGPDRIAAQPGGTGRLAANLLHDSAGGVLAARDLPAVPVAFATTAGTLDLAAPLLELGTATSTLTSDASPGADVTATLDAQSVTRHVAFGAAPLPIGPQGPKGVD